jgi:S-adenosylmethionine:tRNA ribosyltransferase-isomerase
MSLRLSDYDYHLPPELIAQTPAQKRDKSRLMVIDRQTGKIEHKVFEDITDYLDRKDLLVLNNTKVIPARIYGEKYGGGAKIEVLLDRKLDDNNWEALIKPAKRVDKHTVIEFGKGFYAEVKDKLDDGKVILYFAAIDGFEDALRKHGNIPLPPYIKTQNSSTDRYQTVYASNSGASAAPTAGLHFTGELLDRISSKKAFVTLHTGYGTFAPVRTEDITQHKIHKEGYEIDDAAIKAIKAAKADEGKIIAVGTTTTRLLESVTEAGAGETDIFIYPGYDFKVVDSLITNFHLPKSTLMMLVSAFAGVDLIKEAYQVAVAEKYRFFSFGDAMLIK